MCMLTLFTIVSCWLALVLRFHHNFTFPLSQTTQCLIHRSCFFFLQRLQLFSCEMYTGATKASKLKAQIFCKCKIYCRAILNMYLCMAKSFKCCVTFARRFSYVSHKFMLHFYRFLQRFVHLKFFGNERKGFTIVHIQILDHIHANNLCDLKSYHSK